MAKMKIDMEALAKECGVQFISCGKEWGGEHGYTEGRSTSICGFKTRKAAIEGWFRDEFNTGVGKILLRDYLQPVKPTK
jgi:hypothetical protein